MVSFHLSLKNFSCQSSWIEVVVLLVTSVNLDDIHTISSLLGYSNKIYSHLYLMLNCNSLLRLYSEIFIYECVIFGCNSVQASANQKHCKAWQCCKWKMLLLSCLQEKFLKCKKILMRWNLAVKKHEIQWNLCQSFIDINYFLQMSSIIMVIVTIFSF